MLNQLLLAHSIPFATNHVYAVVEVPPDDSPILLCRQLLIQAFNEQLVTRILQGLRISKGLLAHGHSLEPAKSLVGSLVHEHVLRLDEDKQRKGNHEEDRERNHGDEGNLVCFLHLIISQSKDVYWHQSASRRCFQILNILKRLEVHVKIDGCVDDLEHKVNF